MQNLKHKLSLAGIIIFAAVAILLSLPAYAATPKPCPDNLTAAQLKSCEDCQNPAQADSCLKNNRIVVDLNVIVNFLGGVVAIAVIGTIILGGIQYSMAGESPDAVGKAKQRITNGLIALVAFLFTYAFLQWIVPGGIFNS
jgi:hypothetical protein